MIIINCLRNAEQIISVYQDLLSTARKIKWDFII